VATRGARAAGNCAGLGFFLGSPVRRSPTPLEVSRLEIVAKARYFPRTQEFAMKAARRTLIAVTRKPGGRLFGRGPLAFALALAVAVALFHDLPALAGGGDLAPIPVAIASSTSTPIQAPDTQAPGHGCHCLCHITDRSAVSPVVTPVVFNDSLNPPRNGGPICSWTGLPPFRPPRV
jgi:hypothetical protein